MRRVKIKQGITAEQVGAEKDYFDKFIKSKPLNIVYESTSGYIRVQDQNGEEWGLFKVQYKKIEPAVVSKEIIPSGEGRYIKAPYHKSIYKNR